MVRTVWIGGGEDILTISWREGDIKIDRLGRVKEGGGYQKLYSMAKLIITDTVFSPETFVVIS